MFHIPKGMRSIRVRGAQKGCVASCRNEQDGSSIRSTANVLAAVANIPSDGATNVVQETAGTSRGEGSDCDPLASASAVGFQNLDYARVWRASVPQSEGNRKRNMLQLKQIGPRGPLYESGLRWIVSDEETLEIVATFTKEEDASDFLKKSEKEIQDDASGTGASAESCRRAHE